MSGEEARNSNALSVERLAAPQTDELDLESLSAVDNALSDGSPEPSIPQCRAVPMDHYTIDVVLARELDYGVCCVI